MLSLDATMFAFFVVQEVHVKEGIPPIACSLKPQNEEKKHLRKRSANGYEFVKPNPFNKGPNSSGTQET